jgi:sortase A
MQRYQARRSPAKILVTLFSSLLILSGLLIIGYSFLINDPFATLALFRTDPPSKSTMTLTVPAMKRVEEVPVYNGPAGDKEALHDGALHLRGTGFPWQRGANVYVAGHRLGFPGTKSYLVFWDLDKLEKGDEIFLTNADGTRYTYEVFEKRVISPDTVSIMRPTNGKNIVSLQTCTLPDYSHRLIVQGELKN